MGRLGLKELRNAFNPSRESVADSEIGLYGTATQGEIAQARSDESGPAPLTMNDLRSATQARDKDREPDRDESDQDRGMEL